MLHQIQYNVFIIVMLENGISMIILPLKISILLYFLLKKQITQN